MEKLNCVIVRGPGLLERLLGVLILSRSGERSCWENAKTSYLKRLGSMMKVRLIKEIDFHAEQNGDVRRSFQRCHTITSVILI